MEWRGRSGRRRSSIRRRWRVRAVISLAGRTATVGGVPTCLVSLELWSTEVRPRLAYTDLGHHQMRQLLQASSQPWRGWDDVGTQYHGRGSSGGGSQSLYIKDVSFAPGLTPRTSG